jgi:DNA-binding MarR family transcriptional regulator
VTIQSPPLTGQDINLAARAVRDVLDGLLDQAHLSFIQFVALQTLATPTPPADRAALTDDIATRLRADTHAVSVGLAGLGRRGLIADVSDQPRLTAEGRQLLERTLASVSRATTQLHADFAPDELATTRRVLVELIDRAPRVRVEF